MPASIEQLTESVKFAAQNAGFDLCGICPAVAPPGLDHFHQWLDAGFAGEMTYFEKRRSAYQDPRSILEGVRSIVLLGLNYNTQPHRKITAGLGRVSRYAWGRRDYHEVIREKLDRLKTELLQIVPGALVRGVVDTAPLLEREFAVLAGIGWQGKNTLILNKRHGSWFFLAALLTDQELQFDAPVTDHCGTCTACLDACPTNAFVQPNVLDARRCISYLTIELKGPMPPELRPSVGDWVFGCDVCQDVCPWTRKAPRSREPDFEPTPDLQCLDLFGLFTMTDEQFRQRFRNTPLWRPKRRGILRNAAVVLGNQKNPESIEALRIGLNDHEPIVRGACAWALGRIGCDLSREYLLKRQAVEKDDQVLSELTAAIDEGACGAG